MKKLLIAFAMLIASVVGVGAVTSTPASANLYNCSLFPGNPSSYEGSSCASQDVGGSYYMNQQRAAPNCSGWINGYYTTYQAFGSWVGRNITSYAYCASGFVVTLWQLQRR